MIVTRWNMRGLNSKGKQRYLKERVKKDKPSIMIIQETKINSQKLEEIERKYKIQYEVMAQDTIDIVGGLHSYGTQRRCKSKIGSVYLESSQAHSE